MKKGKETVNVEGQLETNNVSEESRHEGLD
jgi:hypothetical protein